MKAFLFLICTFLSLLLSCKNSTKNQTTQKPSKSDSAKKDSLESINQLEETLRNIPKNVKPIFGYRLIISGDFNGDGKKEKLIEHFFSLLDKKETNKFYDGLTDYGQLVALTVKKEPFSFLI